LNIYYSLDKTGHFHDAEDIRRAFNTNFNQKRIEANLKKLEAKLKTSKDYKLLSDYAVLLLKAGKTKSAIDILEQLSEKYPDEYQIAANLGTAYELDGNVEKALKFIKRGIELNPDAHNGSEWVHVNLLETKLKLEQDGTYLANHSVLNLSEEQKKNTSVRDQLMIQIRERFPFCKGPDPIMASLLVDLGDCYANTTSIEFAKAAYEIAQHYYGASTEIIDPRMAEVKNLLRQYSSLNVDRRALRYEDDRGTHLRMSPISYKKMLDDNNSINYSIDWSNVQSNTDSLLAFAEIERVMPPTVEVEKAETQPKEKSKIDKKEEASYTWIYLLVIGLILGGGALLLYTKRKS
jgi:tetratricopeptide (TPR) repeat protein